MSDHYVGEDGMHDNELYMTIDEQKASLHEAGFDVDQLLKLKGMVLHLAA
jgi:hypothetical protein